MQLKTIRHTELNVSELCLGLSQLGLDSPVPEGEAMLDRFADAGGNFVDTARIYSDWVPGMKGRSEQLLGAYLRKRKNRDRFVICSKGGHFDFETPGISRATPADVIADLEASLKALGTDRIDLYMLHRDSTVLPVETLLEPLEEARRAGKIREYGVSNWCPEHIREAAQLSKAGIFHGIRCDQEMLNFGTNSHHSLSDPTQQVWSAGHAAAAREADCAVMAFSGQAGGFFQKIAAGVPPEKAGTFYNTAENRNRAEQLLRLSKETKIDLSSLLLLYLTQAKTLQIFPIVRCRTPEQLDNTLQAVAHTETVDFGSLRDFE
ncbi:MAG: aldo/keto reductase [Victivallaceae bacterium]|nr:aldo/keto reductase [Victivallaceae bacterium]